MKKPTAREAVKTSALTIRIEPELLERLKNCAQREQRTQTIILVRALEAYLDAAGA
jgi:predicted transcriptional regulator